MTGRLIQKSSVSSASSAGRNAIDRTRVRRRPGRRSRRRSGRAGHGQAAVLSRARLRSLPRTRRSRLLRVIFSSFRSQALSARSCAGSSSTTVGISATMTRYPPTTTGRTSSEGADGRGRQPGLQHAPGKRGSVRGRTPVPSHWRVSRMTANPGLLHATQQCKVSVCAGEAMIQNQWFGTFSSNVHAKNGGAKGIRTPDLLHAMHPGFV